MVSGSVQVGNRWQQDGWRSVKGHWIKSEAAVFWGLLCHHPGSWTEITLKQLLLGQNFPDLTTPFPTPSLGPLLLQ